MGFQCVIHQMKGNYVLHIDLIGNIHIEGTLSQISLLWPSFDFMSKNGKLFIYFF